MKIYRVNGFLRWYNEGEQPEGAIEVTKDKKVAEKSVEPQNKSRKESKK